MKLNEILQENIHYNFADAEGEFDEIVSANDTEAWNEFNRLQEKFDELQDEDASDAELQKVVDDIKALIAKVRKANNGKDKGVQQNTSKNQKASRKAPEKKVASEKESDFPQTLTIDEDLALNNNVWTLKSEADPRAQPGNRKISNEFELNSDSSITWVFLGLQGTDPANIWGPGDSVHSAVYVNEDEYEQCQLDPKHIVKLSRKSEVYHDFLSGVKALIKSGVIKEK